MAQPRPISCSGTGNDALYGKGENDTLDGGAGNDWLDGGAGNDKYLFARGDGQDTIYDYDTTAGNKDTIQFAEGIAANDVQATRSSEDLTLSLKNSTDKITIRKYFVNDSYAIEGLQFGDGAVQEIVGSVWDLSAASLL